MKSSDREHEEPEETHPAKAGMGHWAEVISATGSPLRFFALTVLVCNSAFGIAAAWKYEKEVFIYTLHTFLAIVAAFVLIALWSPRSFYSPSDLSKIAEVERGQDEHDKILPDSRPIIPTIIISIFVLIYAAYQKT